MRKFLAVLAVLAGIAAYVRPTLADVPTIYSNYGQPLSSTAASGTSSVLFPNGQGSCVVEITSLGGATVTVKGTVKTDGSNPQTNTAFGTSGVISAAGVYQGGIASYPGNFFFTWTGNTGTLTYTEACSGPVGSSTGSGGGGGGGSVTQGTVPWVVSCQSGGCPTPIPFPATQAVSLPASYQTAFPTPIPFPATQAVSLPASYQTAFPTPIPFPATQAVSCASASTCPVLPTFPYTYGYGLSPTAGSFVGSAGYNGTSVESWYVDSSGIGRNAICTLASANCANVNSNNLDVNVDQIAQSNIMNGNGGNITVGSLTGMATMSFTYAHGSSTVAKLQPGCDQTAAVNITTATTTGIVAVSGSTAVYVCTYNLYIVSGTTPGFQFVAGTGSNCATVTQTFSGTFGGTAAAVGENFPASGGGVSPIFWGPASSGFCIVSSGTTPDIQGYITYAQY